MPGGCFRSIPAACSGGCCDGGSRSGGCCSGKRDCSCRKCCVSQRCLPICLPTPTPNDPCCCGILELLAALNVINNSTTISGAAANCFIQQANAYMCCRTTGNCCPESLVDVTQVAIIVSYLPTGLGPNDVVPLDLAVRGEINNLFSLFSTQGLCNTNAIVLQQPAIQQQGACGCVKVCGGGCNGNSNNSFKSCGGGCNGNNNNRCGCGNRGGYGKRGCNSGCGGGCGCGRRSNCKCGRC